MTFQKVSRFAVLALFASAVPSLHAGLVAQDENLPASMSWGGTEDDPAIYILGTEGAVTRDIGATYAYVGFSSSYNQLTIQSGSTLIGNQGVVGYFDTSTHNTVRVTGPGSSWIVGDSHPATTTDGWFEVGSYGSHNQVTVENGAHLSAQLVAYIGKTNGANYNRLRVIGSGTTMTVGFMGLNLGSSAGNYNTLHVGDGATLTVDGSFHLASYGGGDHNAAFVYGAGSMISMTQLAVGVSGGTGNSLTLQDGGLVRISDYWSINYALKVDSDTDNFINFADGFIAIEGDATHIIADLIDDGAFRIWDGSTWKIAGLDDMLFGYFADDADAFAFSGYADLGGYTIVTNLAGTAIPEPSTYAALAGCAVLGLAIVRRYRRKSGSSDAPLTRN